MKKIYLDYSATTPTDPNVLESIIPFFTEKFGNPSSIHTFGQETRTAIEVSRDSIAKLLKVRQSEIFFTSGGTESINFALIGASRVLKKDYGKTKIISSLAEHHATLETCKFLEKQGFEVVLLKPDSEGKISIDELVNSIDDKTGLVSLLHINNETGSINDILEIAEETSKRNILLHIDAVQSFGKYLIDLSTIKIDMLSASSHKIFGPKGAGFLFIRTGTPIEPIIFGGSQERNRRGGTENLPGIVGLAKAAELAYKEMQESFEHVSKLKNYFLSLLEKHIDKEIFVNGGISNASPYILNISLNPDLYDIDENTLIMNFAIRGVAVSSGSACTSGVLEPSHVLLAMGFDEKRASMAVRFSFSKLTRENEIDYAYEVLCEILNRLKKK